MEERIDVICMGILVADIFTSPIDRIPKPGQLASADEIFLSGGGHAHNTPISLARLGTRVGIMGKVGNDPFGDFLIEDLKKEGVDTSRITISNKYGTSKTMVILTSGKDRRFIYTAGANADFGIEDIDYEYLKQAKVLYVGGYGVLPKLDEDSLVKVLKFAKENDIITLLDVVIPHTESNWINKCKKALKFTDFFLPNNDEAKIITGQTEPEEQAKQLLKYNPKITVIITMGGNGSLVRTKDKIIRASSYKIEVVDGSGGGDAFSAGLIFGLMNNWSLTDTLKLASAMGASAVRKMGTTPGVFTREEATSFIQNNQIKITHEKR